MRERSQVETIGFVLALAVSGALAFAAVWWLNHDPEPPAPPPEFAIGAADAPCAMLTVEPGVVTASRIVVDLDCVRTRYPLASIDVRGLTYREPR